MFYFRCWWEVEGNVFVIFFTKRLKHRSFLLLLRRPPEGRLTPRGKTRLPSACSETHRGAETNSDDDSCLFTFHISYVSDCTGAAQCLTVRLLIPSENAPICLTVPSESSICQEINKQTNRKQTNQIQTEEPNWTSWSVSSERSWAAAEASPYLFQVFQVLLVDQDSSSLEAAALWHFHVHGADVLLAIILTFLPQSAKTAERQTSGLNETKGDGLS